MAPCSARATLPLTLAAAALAATGVARAEAKRAAAPVTAGAHGIDFRKQVAPVLAKYCVGCHSATKKKAGLDLQMYFARDEKALLKDVHVFQTVAERLEAKEMPPEEKPQLTEAEQELVLAWVDQAVGRAAADGKRDPGRVTIRRLNRAEYTNTVRDLFGVTIDPAKDFPSDDVGYGFDNIGDVLSMPPVLIERYMTAAERIAERVIVADPAPKLRTQTFQAERLSPTPTGSAIRGGLLVLSSNASLRARHEFPADAEYVLRVRAAGRGGGGEAARLAVRVDGTVVKTIDVRAPRNRPRLYTIRVPSEPGTKQIELAFLNAANEPARARARKIGRTLAIDYLQIEGPLNAKALKLPYSHTRLIPRPPSKDGWREEAREWITTLATRAYRRPVRPEEVARLVRFVEQAVAEGETFERGMQTVVRAVLVSPHFLYRVELDGGDATATDTHPISDHALASRLSYFLWSSMPDEELFRLAADGSLRKEEVLQAQVRRMVQDRKASALVDNFATQWLQIRNLQGFHPSKKMFPGWDGELRNAMIRETQLFFRAVMRDDLSVMTFLDSDFTFVNERLARHYGIPGVEGREFRRVSVAGTGRGGVLTQGSVLAVTSNPTRTSPVKRGRWVLEQLLGSPPPPPPPDVPDLPNADERAHLKPASLRALMEQHRKDPGCAVCHKKMDPLGFGLENFDAIGGWRDHEGEQPVDASGVLPNGQAFRGPTELKAVLKTKQGAFRRALVQKMLTYALGRGTEPYDRPAIDEIATTMTAQRDAFSSLVLGIVRSDPFQKRRGSEAQP